MSETIKAGDLVQVVRPAKCGCFSWLGLTFRVEALVSVGPAWHCRCGAKGYESFTWDAVTPHGLAIRVLKRIPPLSELEGEKTQEDIREPA